MADGDMQDSAYHWTTVAAATSLCVAMAAAGLLWWTQTGNKRLDDNATNGALPEHDETRPVVCG
jgi:hypothetical protein